MNIDLGWLGKVTLEELETPLEMDGFLITHDGYTESGIRVHAVISLSTWKTLPACWNNAIIIHNRLT